MGIINTFGAVLLLHSAYSSYEHHHALKNPGALPTDIILELIIGLLLVNFGTLHSLKCPISVTLEKGLILENCHTYLKPIEMSKAMIAVNELGYSEYEYLETRIELMDVVTRRKKYTAWANGK